MYIVIFITAASKKEARHIAQGLVEARLAACVNIIDKIESIFRWQGKVDSAREALLAVKSKRVNFPKIVKLVKSLHSYAVPEIIALPVIAGSRPYLDWIDDSLR